MGQRQRRREEEGRRSQYKHDFLYTGNAIKAVQEYFSMSHFTQMKTKTILKLVSNLGGAHGNNMLLAKHRKRCG